jgi:hypothetical protein
MAGMTKKSVTKISTLYRVDGYFGLLSRNKKYLDLAVLDILDITVVEV